MLAPDRGGSTSLASSRCLGWSSSSSWRSPARGSPRTTQMPGIWSKPISVAIQATCWGMTGWVGTFLKAVGRGQDELSRCPCGRRSGHGAWNLFGVSGVLVPHLWTCAFGDHLRDVRLPRLAHRGTRRQRVLPGTDCGSDCAEFGLHAAHDSDRAKRGRRADREGLRARATDPGSVGPKDHVHHVLPNLRTFVLGQASVTLAWVTVDLAALSFLGLGVQQPTVDWGVMVAEGKTGVLQGYPTASIAAGLCLVVAVVSFIVVGQRLSRRAEDGHAMSMLTIEGLRLTVPQGRGRRELLRGIDLTIDEGETLGLVGESGSGKSLTARAAIGLLPRGAAVSWICPIRRSGGADDASSRASRVPRTRSSDDLPGSTSPYQPQTTHRRLPL